jgi:AcrR family transcriptional regulator
MSKLTKIALSKSLKKELEIKKFDKITVKEVVERAGVNRQTFYYHFQDIYDLLEWTFAEDLSGCHVEPFTMTSWTVQLKNVIDYIDKNRVVVENIYNSLDHDFIRKSLGESIRPSIEEAITGDINNAKFENDDITLAVKLITWVVVECLMEWVSTHFKSNPYQTLEQVEHLFGGLMSEKRE